MPPNFSGFREESPVSDAKTMYEAQKGNFERWEILKVVIGQQIDLMLI